jgi:hypothetical protein
MTGGRPTNIPAAPPNEREYYTDEEIERLCLAPKTRATYDSWIRTHTKRGYPLSRAGVEQHLKCRAVAGKLTGLIDAYDFHRRCHGKASLKLQQRGRMLRICTAREADQTGRLKTRGAIDEAKLDLLLAYVGQVRGKHTVQDKENVLLCWATGLRQGDMERLMIGHFRRNRTGSGSAWQVEYEVHKDPHRLDKKEAEVRILDVHARGHALVRRLVKSVPPGGNGNVRAAPGWCTRRLNNYIKQTAALHRWDERLDWVGVHGLRHGVISEVFLKDGLDAARAVSGHAPGSRAIKRYCRTNEERTELVEQARADGVSVGRIIGGRTRRHLSNKEKQQRTQRREEEHHHEQVKKAKKENKQPANIITTLKSISNTFFKT